MGDVGIGAVLREARTEQDRGLDEAAAATSMRVSQVEALEDDRFEQFGGDVYAKGFLRSYATWLGLDPAPLLDRYRRYIEHDRADTRKLATGGAVVTASDGSDLPMWLVRIVAALGVVALGVGLFQLVQERAPSPAEEPEIAAPPEPVEPTPTPSATGTGTAAPTPEPSPSPTPSYEGVELTLAFDAESWVSVQVDGQTTQEGLFAAGDVLDLQGDQEVVIVFGNAGGVTGLLNGETVGPFGGSGTVAEIRFTPDGFDEV